MTATNIVHGQAGDTLVVTWVNCGVTPSQIVSNLINAEETLVSSMAAVSSGNGRYYAPHTLPSSKQWLINRWFATINANTYVRSQFVDVQELKV